MTTPSGPGRPAPPAPPGPQVPGVPLDPRLVEQMANALFREAFAMPVTTPSQMPPPSESSAVVPPRGGEMLPAMGHAPAALAAPAMGAAPAQGMGPLLGAAPGTGAAPGSAPMPAPSPTPPAVPMPGPGGAGGMGAMPTSGTQPSAGFAPSPEGLMGLLGSLPQPASASTMGAPPPTPGMASPSPVAAGAPPPADDAPYWLSGAPGSAPAPGCRHSGDLENQLIAAALGSVPGVGSPAEAEAERQTEGRGLASPLPSLERIFADAARFAAMPGGGGAPGAPPAGAPPSPAAPSQDGLYFLGAPAVPRIPPSSEALDVETVRRDFPALHQHVHGKPLIWLDNAATTQKPQAVIDAISRFYARDNSNIHRAAHELARRATEAYENAREVVRRFLNAGSAEEIVFVRGTTEGINLVANTWGRQNLGPGDEIVLTTLEHHANIVPWQFVAREKGAVIKVVPITDRGEVIFEEYARLLGPRTKIVAVTQVSNALGTVVPVREMAALAHRHGAPILVDGAQSVPHMRADVQDIDADFFVFSGHKIFGPTGIGAVYGKKALLETMPPWQGGGSMIRTVTFEQSTFSDPPAKFEAGTPNIADAVGLAAALEYVERLGIDRLGRYEHGLLVYAQERMKEVPGLRPIGTAPHKASVLSFVFDGVRVEDVGRYLDSEGIAVRAGHHCAMPSLARLGLQATVRPSLAFYNTRGEVDRLVEVLKRFRHA